MIFSAGFNSIYYANLLGIVPRGLGFYTIPNNHTRASIYSGHVGAEKEASQSRVDSSKRQRKHPPGGKQ